MSTPTAALPVTEQPVTEQPATTPRTMQAIVFDDFGGPEVLVAREIPVPEVRPHDLLVRNASIGVNRADLLHRKGACGRAYFGDADTMGLEIAGTVVAMGPEVQGFAVGDRVMGIVGGRLRGAVAHRPPHGHAGACGHGPGGRWRRGRGVCDGA